MTKQEVIVQVERIFHEVLNKTDIILTETTTAKDVEGWDSLTNMGIIVKVEETFGCRFKLREIIKMKNIGDLCDAILNQKNS